MKNIIALHVHDKNNLKIVSEQLTQGRQGTKVTQDGGNTADTADCASAK